MEFMFCDLHVSLKLPIVGDIASSNLSCLKKLRLVVPSLDTTIYVLLGQSAKLRQKTHITTLPQYCHVLNTFKLPHLMLQLYYI